MSHLETTLEPSVREVSFLKPNNSPQSKNSDNMHWSSDEAFDHWLSSAHTIIHEWFFALIEGDLRQGYENGS